MLSILISFPVFSFTGLSRPAYTLFFEFVSCISAIPIAVLFAIVYNSLISLF